MKIKLNILQSITSNILFSHASEPYALVWGNGTDKACEELNNFIEQLDKLESITYRVVENNLKLTKEQLVEKLMGKDISREEALKFYENNQDILELYKYAKIEISSNDFLFEETVTYSNHCDGKYRIVDVTYIMPQALKLVIDQYSSYTTYPIIEGTYSDNNCKETRVKIVWK